MIYEVEYLKVGLSTKEKQMKNKFLSKTVWFNIIVLVVAIMAMPEFISILPVSLIPLTVFIGAFGNLILRIYFTKTAIK